MIAVESFQMKNTGICINRMISARENTKKLRKELRLVAPKHPELGKPIDWKFIQKGKEGTKQIISFKLKQETRTRVSTLLRTDRRKLNARKKELKISIVSKFRDEFIAIYTRYRREVMKEKGKIFDYQICHHKDFKSAESAALNCFHADVTPAEVIHYWHKKLKNFANRNIEMVPLSMMVSSSVVEEVAIDKLSSNRNASELDESEEENWKSPKRKTMWLGDSSTLHPRLRRELMAAGFDLSRHNDSDLSTIQDYAMDVKSGEVGIRLIPEALRPMIRWALENTLKNYEVKDFLYKS